MKRTIRLPTVSSIHRVNACPGSEVLLDRINEKTDRASRGDDIHQYSDAVGVAGLDPKLAIECVSEEWRPVCERLDVQQIYSGIVSGLRSEVAYAVCTNDESVRELGHHLGRNYPKTTPFEVRGSEDFEGLLADGTPIVGDIKSGAYVGEPSGLWQLLFFAYCAMIRTGAEKIRGRIAYVRETGAVDLDECTFTAERLLDVPAQLRSMRDRVGAAFEAFDDTGRLVVNPGDHCGYCEGYASCASKKALIQSMLPELANFNDRFAAMTPEQVGNAWLLFEQLRPLYEKTERALKEYAKAKGIELSDGRRVRAVESTRTSFSKDRATELLKELGASDEQLAKCMVEGKFTSVRALGKKVAA